MTSTSLFRLPSSLTPRIAFLALSAVGLAVAVKLALDHKTPHPEPVVVKKSRKVSCVIPAPTSTIIKRSWPKPAAIALQYHSAVRDYQRSLQWNIRRADGRQHTLSVEKHLYEQFFLCLPRSIRAPCQISFDIEPRLLGKVDIDVPSLLNIADLHGIVLRHFEHTFPRTQHLLLTYRKHHNSHRFNPPTHEGIDLTNNPNLPLESTAAQDQWYHELLSDQIYKTANALANHFTVDVDFRILLRFGIPPPGFEACMIGQEVIPPGPHEEPPYTPRKPSHAKAPRPTIDFLGRFSSNSAGYESSARIAHMSIVHEGYSEVTVRAYHKSQVSQASKLKQRLEKGKSRPVQEHDCPQASDYFLHHAFSDAYQHEVLARHLRQLPAPDQDRYIQRNWKYFQNYAARAYEAENYWAAHADEYKAYFPQSVSELDSLLSPLTTTSLLSLASGESCSQVTDEKTRCCQDLAAVLYDPAVVKVVIKGQSFSEQRTSHGHESTSFASVSIFERVFRVLYPDRGVRSRITHNPLWVGFL